MSKREQILDTALTLFVEQGIAATATAQIAKVAGVATGTLFHHFPSKAELVAALYRGVKQQLADAMATAPPQGPLEHQAQQYWQRGLAWAQAQPRALQFLQLAGLQGMEDRALRHQTMSELLPFVPALLQRGQAEGVLRPIPADLALEQCHSQFMSAAAFFIAEPEKADDPSYQDAAFGLFWHSLAY
ncbi:TetR/AcrR family transcriptional regulator [Ferrimonas balearica]|uniref:TetR/AcrR family transcriptional regulator n=1 Tax=Ferrimonas balearica TaxID=44012 RepID=UPI001F3CFCF8|nr:TetR/AcrR family transcriptional regulator [Ferrimonas balearica]MBY6018858.1 TetR/AcrR family transcriptional regulator [Halomonas denitrificans]MBY6096048.1 TetR/AcrR family transcriptional regulator [Ferrimonas balearica]